MFGRQESKESNSMRRQESKGMGLADLNETDPMSRRLEKERKERYAQELREQMRNDKMRRSADDAIWRERGENPHRAPSSASNPLPSPGSSSLSALPVAYSDDRSHQADRLEGRGLDAGGAAEKVAQLQDLMRERLQLIEQKQQQQFSHLHGLLQNQISSAREAAETAAKKQLQKAMASHSEELRRAQEEARDAAARAGDASLQLQRKTERMQETVQQQERGLWAACNDVHREVLNVLRDVQREQQSCSAARADCDAALREAQQLRGAQQAQQGSSGAARVECEAVLREVQQMRAAQQALEESAITATKGCKDACAAVKNECDSLAYRVDSLEKLRRDLEKVSGQLSEHSTEIHQASGQVKRHSTKIERLSSAIEGHSRSQYELQRDLQALRNLVCELRSEQGELSFHIEQIPGLIDQLRRDRNLRNTLGKLRTALDRPQRSVQNEAG
eukprot:gnl/TRDRNA2_/TRDRNA2_30929_c0_seq1.p1 gnl/TRDRNA2_/TRDRNA2_30929_c0~~gnl/TRDRNA2_/TRDRNA2_30929_c0_seq1.p1  ORF type:complete len:448 (+),score=100.05 gnl/TRDRNA2_/TRDRNA2_30929_c0_seq1:38-1381(+)